MKKFVFICLLMISGFSQAQDDQEFKKETVTLLKLTGASNAFENAISQMGYSVKEENKEAYMEEAKGTLDGLFEKIAQLYMEAFTPEEIKELIAFYNTDLGKKLASKQFELGQKAIPFGQTWGMEIQGIAQKYQ